MQFIKRNCFEAFKKFIETNRININLKIIQSP